MAPVMNNFCDLIAAWLLNYGDTVPHATLDRLPGPNLPIDTLWVSVGGPVAALYTYLPRNFVIAQLCAGVAAPNGFTRLTASLSRALDLSAQLFEVGWVWL
jgi:hypothetical protein